MRGIKSDILKASYRANAVPWERVAEKYYGELQAKIGDYNDDQFKDYYFGGDTFDHSSGRMSESAPAYQRLLAEDESDGTYKDGRFAEGYGPGSADWEGRLLALKGQSFVKGSFYRREATDKIFKNFEKQYTDNVAAYKADNPADPNGGRDKQSTIVGGKRGIYNPANGEYEYVGYQKNQILDVDKQVSLMVPGGVFYDYNGNKYRMSANGTIRGFHASGDKKLKNKVIKVWDSKLNKGEGGFSNETRSWTKEEFLDDMYGISNSNFDPNSYKK
jgi:hypothetical protein